MGNEETVPQEAEYGQVEPGMIEATNLACITRGTRFAYTKVPEVYRCPAGYRQLNGRPDVRTCSMNNWMNGLAPADWTPGLNASRHVYKKDTDVPSPAQLFVFVDEDPGSINDALLVVILDAGFYMNDVRSRVHRSAYPLGFADGHAESFKLMCSETRDWHSPDPGPPEITDAGTPNEDLVNLRNAAYITWQAKGAGPKMRGGSGGPPAGAARPKHQSRKL